MTLKHISFGNSEVMRELERLELARTGPEDQPEIQKEASEGPKDLLSRMVCLAKSLRESGRTEDADRLDDKLALYCTADTHLYRAHDEDGEDLLDFAHPDGDVEVAPAQEGRGRAETLVSQHKKILDIVNKAPTGKFASKTDDILKAAHDILKGAQSEFVKTDEANHIRTLAHNIKLETSRQDRPVWEFIPALSIGTGIRLSTGENVVTVMGGKLHTKEPRFAEFAKAAAEGGNPVTKSIMDNVNTIGDFKGTFAPVLNAANSRLTEWFGLIDSEFAMISSLKPTELGRDLIKCKSILENWLPGNSRTWLVSLRMMGRGEPDKKKVFAWIVTLNDIINKVWTQKTMSVETAKGFARLWRHVAETAASSNKDEAWKRTVIKFANDVAGVFDGAGNQLWETTYDKLVGVDYESKRLTTPEAWESNAKEYLYGLGAQGSRKLVNKIAAPPTTPPALPGNSVILQEQDWSAKKKTPGAPGAGRRPARGGSRKPRFTEWAQSVDEWQKAQPSDWWKSVKDMQGTLNLLGKQLTSVNSRLPVGERFDSNEIARLANDLTSTGYVPYQSSYPNDGKWGKATVTALKAAQEVLRHLPEGQKANDINPGPSPNGYLTTAKDKAAKSKVGAAADQNTIIISTLMGTAGVGVSDPSNEYARVVFDKLPSSPYLYGDFPTNMVPGPVRLMGRDLADLTAFSQWGELNSLLSVGDGLSPEQWIQSLKVLYGRATTMLQAAERRKQTEENIARFNAYVNAVIKLYERLDKALRRLKVVDRVTAAQLEEAYAGATGGPTAGAPGAGTHDRGPAGPDAGFDVTQPGGGPRGDKPPIQKNIYPEELAKYPETHFSRGTTGLPGVINVNAIATSSAGQLIGLLLMPQPDKGLDVKLRELNYNPNLVVDGRFDAQYPEFIQRFQQTRRSRPRYIDIGGSPAEELIEQEWTYRTLINTIGWLRYDLSIVNKEYSRRMQGQKDLVINNHDNFRDWWNALKAAERKVKDALRNVYTGRTSTRNMSF